MLASARASSGASIIERFEGIEPCATTRAGDGYARRAFTAAEVFRMQELGIIDGAEGFELIEGNIVMMQSKNAPHERIKLALNRALAKALPDELQLGVETSRVLGDRSIFKPDLSTFPMKDTTSVRGPEVLLAIEVATTMLRKDLKLKAALYAKFGIRAYRVISTKTLTTTVHKALVDGEWTSVEVVSAETTLRHASAPPSACGSPTSERRRPKSQRVAASRT